MKKFLGIMAGIFFVLAIIFYVNSIKRVEYGNSRMEVANIQMTVFAAASAVLCGINFVGALLSYKIDNVNDSQVYYLDKKNASESKNTPSASMLSRAVNSIEQEKKRNEWICVCGASNNNSATYCYRCRRSKSEMDASKVTCPHCGAQNRLTNTVCFACNQPLAKEDYQDEQKCIDTNKVTEINSAEDSNSPKPQIDGKTTSVEKKSENPAWIDIGNQKVKCPGCGQEMTVDYIHIRKKCPECGCQYRQ